MEFIITDKDPQNDVADCISSLQTKNDKPEDTEEIKISQQLEQVSTVSSQQQFEYSAEQVRFMNEVITDDSCLIACPGAGKSTSILLKIDQMAKSKQIKGKTSCLILTFSNQQCDDLKAKTLQNDFQGIGSGNIMTIHSLCGKIYNTCTQRSSSSKKTIVVAVNKLLIAKPEVLKSVPCLKNVKYMFVDEAQDLSEDQYNTAVLISKYLKVPVIMIGDPNQNIYQFQGSMNKFLLNHSKRQLTLSINNRSTDEIVDFVTGFQVHPQPMQGSGKSGQKPFIFQGLMPDICFDIIKSIKKLLANGISYHEICIIGPVKMQKQYGSTPNSIGLQSVCNLLEENDIPYQQRYVLSNNNEDSACSEIKPGHINILTIHGSKGLEFKAVIILDFKLKSMNKAPTVEQYETFKYLWFVALSRAKSHLRIYNLITEQIWPGIHSIDSNLFNCNTALKLPKKHKFTTEMPIRSISVVQMLSNNQMFSPATVFKFEQLLDFQVQQEQIYDQPVLDQSLDSTLTVLYGLFMENVVEMCQYLQNDMFSSYIALLDKRFYSYITIQSDMLSVFNELDKKYNLKGVAHSEHVLDEILEDCSFKQGQQQQVADFIRLMKESKQRALLHQEEVSIKSNIEECKNDISIKGIGNIGSRWVFKTIIMSSNIDVNPQRFKQLLDDFGCTSSSKQDDQRLFKALFYITLYFFQIENQAAYLLKRDFSETINTLFVYFPLISKYVANLQADISDFQVRLEHPDISIHGIADILTDDKVIELKFAQEYSILHALQAYIYQVMDNANIEENPSVMVSKQIQVFNIRTGILYTIIPNKEVQLIQVLLTLSEVTGLKLRNRVFIYDLETQGLDKFNHEIVQRHVVDYKTNSVVSSGYLNFPLCDYVKQLTNITDAQLASGDSDYTRMKAEFKQMAKCCENPVLIAHNGTSFDHPFLINKGIIGYFDFLLSDSKAVISQHYHEKGNLQVNLSQLHSLICSNRKPASIDQQAHNAVYDVQMIIDMFEQLSIETKDLLVRE